MRGSRCFEVLGLDIMIDKVTWLISESLAFIWHNSPWIWTSRTIDETSVQGYPSVAGR